MLEQKNALPANFPSIPTQPEVLADCLTSNGLLCDGKNGIALFGQFRDKNHSEAKSRIDCGVSHFIAVSANAHPVAAVVGLRNDRLARLGIFKR